VEPNRLDDASAPNTIGSRDPDAPPDRKEAPSYRSLALVIIGVVLVFFGVLGIIQGVAPDNVEASSLGVAFDWLALGLGAFLVFIAGIGSGGSIVWRAIGTAGAVGHTAWLVFGLTQGVPPYIIGLVAIPFGVSLMILVTGSANEVP
jgi:hypothetical protein